MGIGGYHRNRVYRQDPGRRVVSTQKNVERTCSSSKLRTFSYAAQQAPVLDDRTGKALREMRSPVFRVAPSRLQISAYRPVAGDPSRSYSSVSFQEDAFAQSVR